MMNPRATPAPRANAITFPVIAAVIFGIGIAGCAHYTPKPLVPEQTAATLDARTLKDLKLRTFIEKSLGHELPEWPLRVWNLKLLPLVAF